jgi:urease accessory protein
METMIGAAARTALDTDVVSSGALRVRASLRLDFERDELSGRTVLATSHQEPPLRVVRAFAVEDGAAMVHLHNVSGGLLGGDQLGLTVKVGAAACAQITTTGATRIYRPREEAAVTTQTNEVAVGENALLEYLPDPVIPFAGARFSQRTVVRLSRGAGLFWWEILAPGREARGEIFGYASVEMKTELVGMERLVAIERLRIVPENHSLASLARLGPYRTWASFYVCRVGLEARTWLELEQHLRETTEGFCAWGEALWGISTLSAHGLVVRCVASRGRDVLTGLHALWQAAKLRLYGRDAVPPRKVN